MESCNVRQLKNNPSEALRSARRGPVLVLKGDRPEALLVHLDLESMPAAGDVRLALAASLYKDGVISLGRAARVACVGVGAFVSHLSAIGVPVLGGNAEQMGTDLETLGKWLASS